MRGFIQIPLLVGIVAVSALVFGGGGYFIAAQKINQPTQAENWEEPAQVENASDAQIAPVAEIAAPITSTSKTDLVNTTIAASKDSKVSSKHVIELIDTLINKTQTQLLGIGDYSNNIDYYTDWATRGKNTIKPLLDSETDPYLRNEWKYIYDLFDYVLTVGGMMKDGSEKVGNYSVQSLLKSVDNHVTYLKKEKASVPEFYQTQNAEKAALIKLVDASTAYQKDIIDRVYYGDEAFLKAVRTAMDKISENEPIVEAYLSRQKASSAVINKTIYQTIAVPQIQIPKTTYCTMSGGLGGHYSIICN